MLSTPYEVLDERKGETDSLGPVVFASVSAGTVRIRGAHGSPYLNWPVPDDEEAYQEHDGGRTIILYTEQGRVTLVRLTVAQHNEMAAMLDLPDFDSQTDVDDYWGQALG